MTFRVRRALLVVLSMTTLVFALAFSGCAAKKTKTGDEDSSGVADSDISGGMADSDSDKAMGLQTVNFAYDSSILDSWARNKLKENAKILRENSSLRVQIEGHTDERGGIQYNLALGERRAGAARAYLIDQGIDADRMTVISYGKEKPVDPSSSEGAWAKNRRANFRITSN
ncbi:MAG TPA: OmpA family protein [Oligoflexia bacterium]|nr:OmpA family protein [Oligoflexia bacterium]